MELSNEIKEKYGMIRPNKDEKIATIYNIATNWEKERRKKEEGKRGDSESGR